MSGTTSSEEHPTGTRLVAVVPHTHWDREWYEPFQTFRLRAVAMIDGLLDHLERDPSYRHFLLDGQLALVDDYLEIRPEHEGRLRDLVAAGRLSLGPWYVLLDEFLVSGETIIRDLQTGIRRGAAFGGVMEVGYLPDMFGHVAQMPQLLRLAGMSDAVVWRGVPSSVDRSAFTWVAPDGSEVRAEYLMTGYGNGAALPDDAKALLRRLDAHLEEVGSFLPDGAPLLFMNGTDHQPFQPWLGPVVDEVNRLDHGVELRISSLPEYLAQAPSAGLTRVEGELRSGSRSNLLMGVASNRVDVKQAAARSELALERRAEPLSALFLPPGEWPRAFLDVAWRNVVRNAAHDSVCACSVDEVVDAVLHRYAEARQIADGLAAGAVAALGRSLADAGQYVVNPSARPRSGVVEVVVPADGDAGPDVQVLSERFGLPGSMTLDAKTVLSMLGLIQGSRIDTDLYIEGISLEEDEEGIDVTLAIGTDERDDVPVEEVKRELYTRLSARPDTVVRVTIVQPPIRRLLARSGPVAGFGWARFSPAALANPVVRSRADDGSVTLANGLVTVVVDPTDGTFAVDGVPGYGRLVDGGDHGDTYNYSPPGVDTVVDTPDAVVLTDGEPGPVRASVVVTATYTWPDRVDGGSRARVGSHPVEVTTTVELRADERTVWVATSFTNPSRDHRLRVHLPLPSPATTSRAECAFTVVERGLTAEGRDDEYGLPTFPSRRFVSAGGLTVVHRGLLEYELVDIDGAGAGAGQAAARTLALTLLRSTGMLSRLGMSYRPFPAGPLTAIDGPQCVGPVAVEYAVHVGDADPYALADEVLLPLEVVGSFGGGTRPGAGSALEVRGAEVSAVRRQAGVLEVRVFNPTPSPTVVEFPDRSGWTVDLRGRPLDQFDGSFALGAQAIATVRLDGP